MVLGRVGAEDAFHFESIANYFLFVLILLFLPLGLNEFDKINSIFATRSTFSISFRYFIS